MIWPPEVELAGDHAHLVMLAPSHADALAEAARDGELWKLWFTHVPSPDEMAGNIAWRLEMRAKGSMPPFAVIDAATCQPVGMTTYMNIDAASRRVEIGSTWYRRSVQRTAVNTE
ncbi:MAG TPA: GNAT family N-acetyltransferase, partial [Caulobacteraceae bacterium]|nr:GNAT family N-acetyltransferase [Caulobacteraceae bacterium]